MQTASKSDAETPSIMPHRSNRRAAMNPLSGFVYCRRNVSRVVPMGLVIVLSVFLIASVIADRQQYRILP